MTEQTSGRTDLNPEIVLSQCDVRFTRRSGPGGQNRNKVETAAILHHVPSGLTAEASERRSQAQNREVALQRLRVRIALELRRSVDPSAKPSELWLSRCRGGRVVVNPEHGDFPTMLAEALDMIQACEDDFGEASERLLTTASQLVKLLALEHRALGAVNARRVDLGRPPLKAR